MKANKQTEETRPYSLAIGWMLKPLSAKEAEEIELLLDQIAIKFNLPFDVTLVSISNKESV